VTPSARGEGFRVLGFDVDAEKVAALNRGECYIRHVDAARVKRARATTLFAGIPVAVGRRSALA
jgi:UDP-N-acetyl-D-mannosaminuronate dehydrogenase